MKNLILILIIFLANFTFSQSAGNSTNKIRTFVNKGVENYEKTQYAEAEVNFRKALEKEPNNFNAHFNLGDNYFKQKKYEDAIKSYQNAIAKTNDSNLKAQSYYNIGNSLLKNNKLEESIEAYKNSLKLNPNDYDAKYNLSYAKKMLEKQKQNNQNQNQQNNKDKNNQQNQQNKQDQNKENQNQNQKNEQNQNQQNKQGNNQQQNNQQSKISKEEAERILNALKNNEQDLQKQIRKKAAVRVNPEKDW
ncbi:MAG: hypothetical protein STSR0008_01480 [Ignavibacterium sp.]